MIVRHSGLASIRGQNSDVNSKLLSIVDEGRAIVLGVESAELELELDEKVIF